MGHAVGRIQLAQFGQHHQLLAGEDQRTPWQRLDSAAPLIGGEQHVAIVALGAGVTGNVGVGGTLGQLTGQLGFEALPAQAQQATSSTHAHGVGISNAHR